MMKASRRDILRFAAAGAGLMFLPTILRTARAEVRADAPAKRLLILNLYGGIRASASFFASRQKKYNPYGLIENVTGGVKFPLGKLLDDHETNSTPLADAEYTLSAAWKNARVPRFREIASEFSILGTWDLERGDHIRARLKEPTGSGAGDQAGILTRIAAALTKERGELDVLPFQLAPYAAFGQAGALAQFTPVSLMSPKSLPTKSAAQATLIRKAGNDWAKDDDMRSRLDRTIIDTRARNAKSMAEVYASHRKASRKIGGRLAEPWVNVENGEPEFMNAAFGTVNLDGAGAVPLTNAMLKEVFKKTLGLPPSPYGEEDEEEYGPAADSNRGVAMNAALAIRLFQLGAPAICLEIGGFDTHSQERETAPGLYRFLGRLWATLNWVMKRIPDPQAPGRSLFDTTLIITMSDFGRDPGSTATGFNGGEGSDHGSDPSCYYLPHAVMGGGTKPNRIIGEVSTDDYRGDRAQEKLTQNDLLALMMWSIGLPHDQGEWAIEDTSGTPLDVLVRG